jgi:tetratricopeptide (TPR) repeat protein
MMFANKTHEKGHELMLKGDHSGAIELYTSALEFSPNHPDIFSDRGVCYLHLKNETQALSDFNAALKLQPDYGFRYSARAYARDFFGDTEGAIEDYEMAIKLDPDDAVAFNNLGLVQEKLGFNRKAKENFERADKLSKMEDRLYQLMDELEQDPENKSNEKNTPSSDSPVKISPNKFEQKSVSHHMIDPLEVREKNISTAKEFSKIFTSKQQFLEFLRFLKNGFKIK